MNIDIGAVLTATVVLGVCGVVVGIGLSIFGAKFAVEVDPRETAIRAALPGNNCGACGFPGCDGCAKAILEDRAPVNACPVGRQPCWDKIKNILENGVPEKK